MFIKKIVSVFSLIFLIYQPVLLAKTNENVKKVAVSQIVEHGALNSTRQGIYDELVKAGYEPNKSMHWLYDSAQGNPILATQIAQKFADENADVIIAIGTNSAQAASSASRSKKIPVVFSSVTDPLAAKLVTSLEKPTANVTGVSNRISTLAQFNLFKEVLPKLKRLGIIYNPGEPNSKALNSDMELYAKQIGFTLIFRPAIRSSEVPSAADALASKVDAIFINNDNTALSAFKSIVTVAHRHKIPVFCSDTDMVDLGALAVLGPNQYELGRQTGRMVIKILKGEYPASLAVEFPEKLELHLNEKSAKVLGIQFNADLTKKATRIIKEKL